MSTQAWSARHAYLITGNAQKAKEIALGAAREILNRQEKLESHPDFFYQRVETFGIKDSHDLKDKTATRPFLGDKKIFIIETMAFTTEAANALLKIIEEPPLGTHFFVLVPSAEVVLPTLLSRFYVAEAKSEGTELKNSELINKFLDAAPKKRLDIIKAFFEKEKGEVIELLNEMEVELRNRKNIKATEEVERVKKFLYNPAGSQKMILEHLALTI